MLKQWGKEGSADRSSKRPQGVQGPKSTAHSRNGIGIGSYHAARGQPRRQQPKSSRPGLPGPENMHKLSHNTAYTRKRVSACVLLIPLQKESEVALGSHTRALLVEIEIAPYLEEWRPWEGYGLPLARRHH